MVKNKNSILTLVCIKDCLGLGHCIKTKSNNKTTNGVKVLTKQLFRFTGAEIKIAKNDTYESSINQFCRFLYWQQASKKLENWIAEKKSSQQQFLSKKQLAKPSLNNFHLKMNDKYLLKSASNCSRMFFWKFQWLLVLHDDI